MTRQKPTPAEMTGFADLHRQVAFGESGGKIIWQPRIGCWYDDKVFLGDGLPEPFTGMTPVEVYRELDVSARVYEYNKAFKRIEDPRVNRIEKKLSETDTQITWETPAGKQVAVERKPLDSLHKMHPKWPVESEAELKVAAWRVENETWHFDDKAFDAVAAKWGDLGAPTIYMPRVNVQSLYIDHMGIERGIFAIYDWPDTIAAFFNALEESHDRLMDLINESPVEIVNFGDNVHAGTLSPDLFREYVLGTYQRRAEKLHAGGKFVHAHWDGDTVPLLPFAGETGLDGIEAITLVPQGDATIEEVKEALGDEMFLIDGIPAVFFDKTFSVETLVECTHRLIDLFAPKLILGISDEISSTGDIERVRLVKRIVDEYNAGVSS